MTPEAERKRTSNPLSWRTCVRCGQTDELNQNFCIFCSGKIVVPGDAQPESNAYKKFSWELEQIDGSKVAEKIAAKSKSKSVPSVKMKRPKPKGRSRSLVLIVSFSVLGIVSGASLALVIGQAGLQSTVLSHTSWQNKALIVYTTAKDADILLEDSNQMVYTLTQAGDDGSMSLAGLPKGKYTITISKPDYQSLTRKFDVRGDVPTVLGFGRRWELPKQKK